jgi:hypothetical protein
MDLHHHFSTVRMDEHRHTMAPAGDILTEKIDPLRVVVSKGNTATFDIP